MADSPLVEHLSLSAPADQRQPQPTFSQRDQAGRTGQENISYHHGTNIFLHDETALPGPNQTQVPRSQPILIPLTPVHRRNRDRVHTPLTGRKERRGHCFPFSRTPSPYDGQPTSPPLQDIANSSRRQRRSSSSSSTSRLRRSQFLFTMHTDQMAARYTPTSPLSPRVPATTRPLSPQPSPSRSRGHHSKKDSRGLHTNLPRYHPANFPHGDSPTSTGQFQSPTIVVNRAPHPTAVETPRMMRERQRELIDRAKLSSKIAASPMGIKPDAPRLDPLGSPKGPMTPLALEDGPHDYFAVPKKMGSSPGASPGSHSDTSANDMGEDMRRKKTAVP